MNRKYSKDGIGSLNVILGPELKCFGILKKFLTNTIDCAALSK